MKIGLVRAVLVAAVVSGAMLPGPPLGAQYPPAITDLRVSRTLLSPGESVTVSAEGFCPNHPIRISLEPAFERSAPRTLAAFTSDGQGNFTANVTIPKDIPPGEYELKATGKDRDCVGTRVLGARITVSLTPVPQLPEEPGFRPWMLWLLGLMVVAGTFLIIARMRRSKQPVA